MCILCVVQKWSRRVATMLPWLVIPLIGFWALSQLLPPGFRFEVTSPRLACVLVLLVTLFWYEVLMPQLSSWRARRSARLRERRRLEAMELQKLRKTATRRCRNCHTPYRDQNQGGGRFMCSYCGHVSKRPVLDIQGPSILGIENSGVGKIWNGKVLLENGWICGQDWSENGNWAPPLGGKSNYLGKNGSGFFSSDDRCSAEKSYLGVFAYFCKLLSSFFLSIRWLWRKIFRVSSTHEDGLDSENKVGAKKGENGVNFHESRGEKARRKAEEKRQARIERELLEEEERKQREEVARLVEEQRRLRGVQMEAEREHNKSSALEKEKANKREAEKKRRDKRKDKDRGSSKSNSDVEDLERKSIREGEGKREVEKRNEVERRDVQKSSSEGSRMPNPDVSHVVKGTMATNTLNRVDGSGSRYFDRMKSSFLSPSKAFNGSGFFGRASHNSISAVTKGNRQSTGFSDNVQSNRREVHPTERVTGKFATSGDEKTNLVSPHRPVGSDVQQRPTAQKKSWQQLFTCSSTSPSLNANSTVCHQSQSGQLAWNAQLSEQSSLSQCLDKKAHLGLPLPYTNSPVSTGSLKSSSVSPVVESMFPLVGLAHDVSPEETELFEEPCYVPDPVSLLGPVSESLDNFPLDLGTGFTTRSGSERSHVLKNLSVTVDVNRPGPIESPFSRLRVSEERHVNSGHAPTSSDQQVSAVNKSSNSPEHGTWQMWGTQPLGQDGLDLTGGPASWPLPLGRSRPNQVEILHLAPQEAVKPHFALENQVVQGHGTGSPQKVHIEGCHNGQSFNPVGSALVDNDLWLQKNAFPGLSGEEEKPFSPLKSQQDPLQNAVNFDRLSTPAAIPLFEPTVTGSWSKGNLSMPGDMKGSIGSTSTVAMPHMGGLLSNPDVRSLWSFH